MKTIHILSIILISTSIACSQNPVVEKQENQTPKVLQEKNTIDIRPSYSSKMRVDVVDQLFQEALAKNKDLKQFYESINKLYASRNNELHPYHKYTQTNANYWNSTQQYINQLSDSSLKKSTKVAYRKLQKDYEERIQKHEEALANINQQTINLNDQALLLKLSITQAMMLNYQINELPDLAITQEILEQYMELLKKAEDLKNQ